MDKSIASVVCDIFLQTWMERDKGMIAIYKKSNQQLREHETNYICVSLGMHRPFMMVKFKDNIVTVNATYPGLDQITELNKTIIAVPFFFV